MGDCTRRLYYIVDVCTYHRLDVYIRNSFVYVLGAKIGHLYNIGGRLLRRLHIYLDVCTFSFPFRPNHLETACFTL